MKHSITLHRPAWFGLSRTLVLEEDSFRFQKNRYKYQDVVGLNILSTSVTSPYGNGQDMQIDIMMSNGEVFRYNDLYENRKNVDDGVAFLRDKTHTAIIQAYNQMINIEGGVSILNRKPHKPPLAFISKDGTIKVGSRSYSINELDNIGGLFIGTSRNGFRQSSSSPQHIGISPNGGRYASHEIKLHWDFPIVSAFINQFTNK